MCNDKENNPDWEKSQELHLRDDQQAAEIKKNSSEKELEEKK